MRILEDLRCDMRDDNLFNGAAAVSYYLVFSLFPFAIFLVTILPFLRIPELNQALLQFFGAALPRQSENFVIGIVRNVLSHQHQGLLSFGIVLAVWSSSSGTYALMKELNVVYNVKSRRPWWKARAVALLLTLAFVVCTLTALGLILFGNHVHDWLAALGDFTTPVIYLFAAARWVVISFLLLFNLSLIYYFGPDIKHRFRLFTLGSVLGTVILILASEGFRIYLRSFSRFGVTYGSLAALIILMVWFFIVALVILFGAEVNTHIHPYAPHEGLTEARPKSRWAPRPPLPQT